jgi:tryptophan-rich sensory protein
MYNDVHNINDVNLQALIEIVMLYGAAGAATYAMSRINPTAGLIMLPYMAWLSLATALNYSLWKNNPAIEEAKDK